MSDTLFTLRIKKPDTIWLAVIVSLLVHVLIAVFHWEILLPPDEGDIARGPIQVTLAPNPEAKTEGNRAKEKSPLAKPSLPKPKPKPLPKKPKPKKPKPIKKAKPEKKEAKPAKTESKVLAVEQDTLEKPMFTIPEAIASKPAVKILPDLTIPPAPPPIPISKNAPTDMMSLIKQRREARAAQGDPSAINALEAGKLSGQTLKKSVDEIVKQNLRQPGTNGIFMVTTLNRFEGVFSFQGWRGEYSNAQRRFYQVDTFNASDDIRVLMVSKMIDIIRTHYAGDFQWQSRRLGHTITLSARMKDHQKLVNFLLGEFKEQFDRFLYY